MGFVDKLKDWNADLDRQKEERRQKEKVRIAKQIKEEEDNLKLDKQKEKLRKLREKRSATRGSQEGFKF